jgi:phosphatidylglycerol:prolipoprotein diacylglycerol transferase
MYPSLDLGPLEFPSYFTLLTLGYLLAVLLAWRESFRIPGVDPTKFLDLSILLLIAGLVGARLLHVVADGYLSDYIHLCTDPTLVEGKFLPGGARCVTDQDCVTAELGRICSEAAGSCHPGRDCLRWLKFWYGGLAFYGGLLLAAAVGIWYIHRHRKRLVLVQVMDLAGFGIPLGLVFGRVGCWLAGCCFGQTHDGPLAATFPRFSPAWERHVEVGLLQRTAQESLPVVPTQLIQILLNFVMFVVCWYLFKRRRFAGQVFGVFLILYAVFRFVVEFWRDDHRGIWFGETLSTSQILGIPTLLAGVLVLYWMGRHPRPELLRGRTSSVEGSPTVPESPSVSEEV